MEIPMHAFKQKNKIKVYMLILKHILQRYNFKTKKIGLKF